MRSVGRFEIDCGEEALGSGGYGTVVRAKEKQTGEVMAAKVISHRHMPPSTIQREVSFMQRCDHRNVIALHEYVEAEAESYLFMELATKGELFAHVVDNGNLSEVKGLFFFAQIMAAVEYLHSRGIAHRDLKLENVLIDGADVCKVCDFGLAHQYSEDEKRPLLRDVCGSKSYAAPEVLAERGYDGFAADVWSCGICLFGMLAGFFPLDGAQPTDWRFVQVCQAVAQGRSLTRTVFGFYSRPCVLSDHATDLIDGMLSLSPSTRFSVADVLRHAWLGGEGDAQVQSEVSAERTQLQPPQQVSIGGGETLADLQTMLSMGEAQSMPRYRSYFPPDAVAGLGLQMSVEAAVVEGPVYRGNPGAALAASTAPPRLSRQHAFGVVLA